MNLYSKIQKGWEALKDLFPFRGNRSSGGEIPRTYLSKISSCDTDIKKADVVFVHGLGGKAIDTWKGSNDYYWPEELAKDLNNVEVWSLGYNANPIKRTLSLPYLAASIIAHFESAEFGSYPIIFICHSLGGLLVKQILRNSSDRQDEARRIFNNTKGVAFLATPHAGSLLATGLSKIPVINGSLLFRALEWNDPHLNDLNLWFRDNFKGEVVVYFETLPTKGVIVVDASSSDPGIYGVRPIPVETDHLKICKPTSSNDNIYLHTKKFIQHASSATEVRQTQIIRLDKLSKERCIARWQATGLTRQVAEKLLENLQYDFSIFEPSNDRPLSLIIGEFGIGKSLVSELIFQKWLMQANEDKECSIPIYLKASSDIIPLQQYVEKIQKFNDEDIEKGFSVIIDGMDEVGVSIANQLLDEARVMARVWPKSRIVITSRPLPTFSKVEEAQIMEKLTEEETYRLVSIVVGSEINKIQKHDWAPAVIEAISRPLFAILLGLYMLEKKMMSPKSKGELLTYLVERALGKSEFNNNSINYLLKRLAVLSTDRGNVPILKSELSDKGDDILEIVKSGVIIQDNQLLSFSLPILSQWFAAQAIADGMKNVNELSNDFKTMEFWRYPFIILISFFAHDIVQDKFSVIAENNPAMAAGIIDEGLGDWWLAEDVVPPPATESGKRIRCTMQSWVNGIGRLADFIAPINDGRNLLPLGIAVTSCDIQTSWYEGDEMKDEVYALSDTINEMGRFRFSHPGRHSTWAWRWSLDDLTENLSRILRKRALYVENSPIFLEKAWEISLALTSHGSFFSKGILLKDIKKEIYSNFRNSEIVKIGNKEYEVDIIRKRIEALEVEGCDMIFQPWPGPDLEDISGYIWNSYTSQRLLDRTITVYQKSIEAYLQFVETFFPGLKNRMQMYNTFPAVLRGELVVKDRGSFPTINWYLDPIPLNQKSSVEIVLCEQTKKNLFNNSEMSNLYDNLRRMRPECAEWIGYYYTSQVVPVFDNSSVTEIVYGWVWDDLKRISWVDRFL